MELAEIAGRASKLDAIVKEGEKKLEKPKGIFRKRCPRDNNRLIKEEANDPHFTYRLWHCSYCDYEYGTVTDI